MQIDQFAAATSFAGVYLLSSLGLQKQFHEQD